MFDHSHDDVNDMELNKANHSELSMRTVSVLEEQVVVETVES